MTTPAPLILIANHAGEDSTALELSLRARGFRITTTGSLRATLASVARERPDGILFAPLLEAEGGSEESRRVGEARRAEDPAAPGLPIPLLLVLGPEVPFASLAAYQACLGPFEGLARSPVPLEPTIFEIERILRQSAELRRLRDQSIRDYGTGLFNHRHLLDERLPEELQRARRRGHPLSLLLIDLDDFKRLNTETSYPFANAVLAAFAETLLQAKRLEDIAFRYGGDEFVMVLPETDQTSALAAAERLLAAVRREVSVEGRTWRVSASIGGTTYFPPAQDAPRDSTPPVRLIERANQALKEAKRTKDCARFYREPPADLPPPAPPPRKGPRAARP